MPSFLNHLPSLTLLLLASASALPYNYGSVSCGGPPAISANAPNASAVYFISNEAANSVVSMKINADGSLSDPMVTLTCGAGGSGIDGATGQSAKVDTLFSQGAVSVSGNMLVAVNPGSNSLTLFKIDPANPTMPQMVGHPVDTMGEFPVSAAVSSELSLACVANGGAKAGIACFSASTEEGLKPLDSQLRPFNLNQTTPPVGPTNTVSHVFFNSDKTALLSTVKGDPATNKAGFIAVFPIVNGAVSNTSVQTTPDNTKVLFGSAPIPGTNKVLATDAAFGAALLSIGADGQASTLANTTVQDQKATCWATFSNTTKTVFVTDVGQNRLVEMDPNTGGIVGELNLTNGNPGMIDLTNAGNFLYALSPGNETSGSAVAVVDISGGLKSAREVQNFLPGVAGTISQGMAIF